MEMSTQRPEVPVTPDHRLSPIWTLLIGAMTGGVVGVAATVLLAQFGIHSDLGTMITVGGASGGIVPLARRVLR